MSPRKRYLHTGSEGKRRAAPVGRWEEGWKLGEASEGHEQLSISRTTGLQIHSS